jgi:hypothetical protein
MGKLNTQRLAECLDAALAATTANAKGRLYQEAAEIVFSGLHGVEVVSSNATNAFHSEEIDVGLYVGDVPRGFPLTELLVLVEVKNWDRPLDSQGVEWFVSKLRQRSLKEGLLIAANGVTGDPTQLTSAHDVIQAALREGICILVITDDDLRQLRTSADVEELIKVKLVRLRLRRSSL